MLTNLYKIIKKSEDSFSIKLCDKNHEIFKAHFPSNPLLPGFILIDICEIEFAKKIKKIKKASFLKPILPTQEISFFMEKKGNFLHVNVKNSDENVALIVYGIS